MKSACHSNTDIGSVAIAEVRITDLHLQRSKKLLTSAVFLQHHCFYESHVLALSDIAHTTVNIMQ
jgi:hypothetical protein